MRRSEVPKQELIGQRQAAVGRDRLPAGGLEFFALLARLLRRPRRGDRRLPLLWLVRSDTADLMVELRRFLGQGARRRVPHAVLDADASPGAGDVPALLRELHRQLSLEAFGAARLRFRHYPLADWLMHQSLSFGIDADDSRAALVRRLRDRRGPRTPEALPTGGDAVSIASQVLLWVVRRAVPGVVFRAAVSGRVPVLGRHYNWFMRQQYLAPRQSVTFLGFAERLTAGWRDGEQPDQVNKLLLHAFLEDLRQAYRRRPWRPSDWRRTAYPALLIDHVAPGNVGGELVRLIGDVRTETGRNDPLLIVVSGGQPPPELPEPPPLTEADEAYDEWAEALPEMRRLRRPAAWLVALRPDDSDTGPPSRGDMRPFSAPDPPWWSRRFLPAALCLVLVAALGVWAFSRWAPGCHPSLTGGRVSVEVVASGECVGYSDSAAQVFNDDPGQEGLRTIQQRIFAQNRAAEEVWELSDRRRPFLTLVYLGTLTGNRTGPDEESYVSEREELEGMATAQYALLKESASADSAALLRIVVANGGKQMIYADRAVSMLAELARDDPTVLGVVGLVESRTSTARALRELNQVGLPVLAPTLSADRMDANSRLYLQISAPNADQVKMVDAYAQQVLKVDEAHVYYTTLEGSTLTEDLYVGTLVDGLRQRFGARITRLNQWSNGQRLTGGVRLRRHALLRGSVVGVQRLPAGPGRVRRQPAPAPRRRRLGQPLHGQPRPARRRARQPARHVRLQGLPGHLCRAAGRPGPARRRTGQIPVLDPGRRPARAAALPAGHRPSGRRAGQPRLRRGDDADPCGGESRRPAAPRRSAAALGADLGQPRRRARGGAPAERRPGLPGGGRAHPIHSRLG
ncbi:hypothetical protein ABZ403_05950 [Micromonospora zamorensis]|uniref:hypothetical protein n=1 Tax=Micromonospora zamorensis TaxID=709883 RepID=UPI0033D008B8